MTEGAATATAAGAGAGADDPPALRARDLGRRFGDRWAVRGVTLDVRRGEVLGLLGPNGAGKTTTVRLLTALIEPSEGSAAVEGHDVVRDAEAVRARVGILTETPGLYDKLSASANLDFFGRLHQLPADVRAARIERSLRLFGLWDRRDDVAGTFSKGMKQKLAIARALLHEPAVVFLDEPTAALDPEAAYLVREAIEGLRRTGRTIVLATHNLDEADRLCDRIAFVRGGLLRVDSPARLRGEVGRRLVLRLAGPVPDALGPSLAAAAGVPDASVSVGASASGDGDGHAGGSTRVVLETPQPEGVAPAVVRAAVAGGVDVVEVSPERTSLEQIYFEVMGVRPGAHGATI